MRYTRYGQAGYADILKHLNIDGWILGFLGLATVIFSALDYFNVWPISAESTNSVLVAAIGAMMIALVMLTAKRNVEISELRSTLLEQIQELGERVRTSEIRLVEYERDYPLLLTASVTHAKKFICETFLNWVTERPGVHYLDLNREYHKQLFLRVCRGDIKVRQIQVIYHRQGLEEVVHRLLLHGGMEYYIRYCEPPPKSIPMMHIVSIDYDAFYVGVGYPGGEPADNQVLFVRDANTIKLLKDYWGALWEHSQPLNDKNAIHWHKLIKIGERLGITPDEFEEMKKAIDGEVRTLRRRFAPEEWRPAPKTRTPLSSKSSISAKEVP